MRRILAVRGAIQVPTNKAEAIRTSTAKLLKELIARNGLEPGRIVSAIFTATPDLNADFPAHAARKLGWTEVPLLGATEVDVPGALPRVVRVLVTVETTRKLTPVYLDGAERLRPDLSAPQKTGPRVALIGLGQIGGSLGLALKGWERVGYDRSKATLRAALKQGVIDRAATSIEDACKDAKIAVCAVPVDVLPAVIAEAAQSLPRGAVLMDTGSSRRGVTEALNAARDVKAVGGHPIAGNEGRGLKSAKADLFQDATFALLPVRGGVPPLARKLVKAIGAKPLIVDPKTHDRALARTSHLPYLVAVALATTGRAAHRKGLSGPGFRSMTRVATSDATVYVRNNREEVARAWRELKRALDRATR